MCDRSVFLHSMTVIGNYNIGLFLRSCLKKRDVKKINNIFEKLFMTYL